MSANNNDPGKKERMLDKAHEIRRFEIDLYWKRTTYFSVFTTLLFTGYFAVLTSDVCIVGHRWLLLAICVVGLLFTLIWACANCSGKFWQKYWERKVKKLEQKISELLYTKPNPPAPFSLTRLNIAVVGLVFIMWNVALVYAYYLSDNSNLIICNLPYCLDSVALTLFIIGEFVACVWIFLRNKKSKTQK